MNAPDLWSFSEAAAATNGCSQGSWQATGVSTDSRTLQKGELTDPDQMDLEEGEILDVPDGDRPSKL